jgi:hypothetical protein
MAKKPAYTVVRPEDRNFGKTYVDWIEDWTKWFFLPNADQNNNGSVVFLKGLSASPTDNYKRQGVVMVGNDSLEISKNQMVLLPLITATAVAESGENSQSLYQLVRSDIDNGEDPPAPSNVKIDGEDIHLQARDNLGNYRFETRVFDLNIPSSPYGQTLADLVVPPIKTRDTNLPCVTAGYFVLLKLEAGTHYIFSAVHGSRDQTGLYKASLFYQISVEDQIGRVQPITPFFTPAISPQLKANFISELRKRVHDGSLAQEEFDNLAKYIGQ